MLPFGKKLNTTGVNQMYPTFDLPAPHSVKRHSLGAAYKIYSIITEYKSYNNDKRLRSCTAALLAVWDHRQSAGGGVGLACRIFF